MAHRLKSSDYGKYFGFGEFSMMAEVNTEALRGLIERITFHNPETGYAVLSVQARGHSGLVTLVGIVPMVAAGELFEAEGSWVIDKKYGQQFKAETLRTTPPGTSKGIERYLASGIIKGIGPAFAKRLVDAFGDSVFEILEQHPQRLREVEGIGKKRQRLLLAAWDEQRAVRDIMIYLHGHGVGTSRAFRIYKTYGDKSISIVQANPYCLAQDVWGIGFKVADQIAASIGIDKNSELRARAGVEYVLGKLMANGHCAFPRGDLVARTTELLEITESIVTVALSHELEQERLVRYRNQDDLELIYTAKLEEAERGLAINLRELFRGNHPCPEINFSKAVAWVEDKLKICLAEAQCDALQRAVTEKVLVITGGPGVGKTTLVNAILNIFCAKHLKVVLCAPTGRAAKRLSETTQGDATTIHRLLEYDPVRKCFKHNYKCRLQGQVFVVDESSMLDLELAHHLVQSLPSRAALIMVGDIDQLPSVGPGSVLRDVIDSEKIPVCRLTEVFRQAAASNIITNAHRINHGEKPVYPEEKVADPQTSDFYFINQPDPEDCAQMIVRLVAELVPERFSLDSLSDIQVLSPMRKGCLGVNNLNHILQARLNPGAEGLERFGFRYQVGDKVMQIRNNYDKYIFNGDIGRIKSFKAEEKEAEICFDGKVVVYGYDEFDELSLAYAVTVHKSQGSEYPCVILPLHTQHYLLLQRNLFYTGLTRGRKLVIVVGSEKAMGIAVKQIDSRHRITALRERLCLR